MPSTVERLEELLAFKDQQLEKAQHENEELRRRLHNSVDWMLHEHLTAEQNTLPTPRLELRIVDNWEYAVESEVNLVVKEMDGSFTAMPMGYSRRSGGGLKIETYPTAGEMPDCLMRDLPGIINDMCFYSEQSGLPAFVVLDDAHRYQISSLRPLKLVATEGNPHGAGTA